MNANRIRTSRMSEVFNTYRSTISNMDITTIARLGSRSITNRSLPSLPMREEIVLRVACKRPISPAASNDGLPQTRHVDDDLLCVVTHCDFNAAFVNIVNHQPSSLSSAAGSSTGPKTSDKTQRNSHIIQKYARRLAVHDRTALTRHPEITPEAHWTP